MIPSEQTRIIRLEQLYALTAMCLLYMGLIIDPYVVFSKNFPHKTLLLTAKTPFIVLALYFGVHHAVLVFWGQLGGFSGLQFLSATYLFGILLSFTALMLLSVYSVFTITRAARKLVKKRQKYLYRSLYLIGLLILTHALLLGTHFSDLSGLIPQVFVIALLLFASLEALRVDTWLRKYFVPSWKYGVCFPLVIGLFIGYYSLVFFFPSGTLGFSIHAEHVKQAEKSAKTLQAPPSRVTVDFKHPDQIRAGMDVPLSFNVYTLKKKEKVTSFALLSEKLMHVIIVDSSLTYFNHIHPEYHTGTFTVLTSFPADGRYFIYSEFLPSNDTEQQFSFPLSVGDTSSSLPSSQPPDQNLTKLFGKYQVSLSYPVPLLASSVSRGEDPLVFSLINTETNEPVTNLQPYLGAFGHMVMINQKTYKYLHVHPGSIVPPKPDELGGPRVSFFPMGLTGPIEPGVYRVFAQFNPEGQLFTADFTITLE